MFKNKNFMTKDGDDYPIRIYILFKYDPNKESVFERAKYKTAKLVYVEYPPHSSLNYVWASGKSAKKIFSSPYTERSKMIVLEEGEERINQWV